MVKKILMIFKWLIDLEGILFKNIGFWGLMFKSILVNLDQIIFGPKVGML